MTAKKMMARNFNDVIGFTQHFIQGLWFGDDPMMQLPGFTQDEIKNYRRKLKDHDIVEGSLQTFCGLGAEKRAKLDLFDGDKAKLAQLEKVIKSMPVVEVGAIAFVEGEQTITMADVINLKFTVKYTQLADGQAPGYTHAPHYPF